MSRRGRYIIDTIKVYTSKYNLKLPVPPYDDVNYWEGVYRTTNLRNDPPFEWGNISCSDLLIHTYENIPLVLLLHTTTTILPPKSSSSSSSSIYPQVVQKPIQIRSNNNRHRKGGGGGGGNHHSPKLRPTTLPSSSSSSPTPTPLQHHDHDTNIPISSLSESTTTTITTPTISSPSSSSSSSSTTTTTPDDKHSNNKTIITTTLGELLGNIYPSTTTTTTTTTSSNDVDANPSENNKTTTTTKNKDETILILGCGTSLFGIDLLRYHWKGPIIQLDCSSRLINSMNHDHPTYAKYIQTQQIIPIQDDATILSAISDNSIPCILDKGLIDAFFCTDNITLLQNTLNSVHRVLLSKTGTFCTFSLSHPQFVLPKLLPSLFMNHTSTVEGLKQQQQPQTTTTTTSALSSAQASPYSMMSNNNNITPTRFMIQRQQQQQQQQIHKLWSHIEVRLINDSMYCYRFTKK